MYNLLAYGFNNKGYVYIYFVSSVHQAEYISSMLHSLMRDCLLPNHFMGKLMYGGKTFM